ncbi:unannotated protein [freshwater metagenome]|uniref:Unannotated protein n=1 Tax=freshwater metagenome TaxID=449393 RepID=A0A6J7JAV3_9ZZZZ|nr:hypothetical protein [Actinomycetota bacterium]
MFEQWRGSIDGFFEQWFPTSCVRCGSRGGSPCSSCIGELEAAASIKQIPSLDQVAALVRYDEISRPFIADLKFRGGWSVVRTLAPALSFLLDDIAATHHPDTVLTWAPTTPERVRYRGFDQAEVVTRELARQSGHRVQRLLRRLPGVHQTGRNRAERSQGVHFAALGRVPQVVVVVDDVVTTGSTMAAAASVLRDAGAATVLGLALAATPDRTMS